MPALDTASRAKFALVLALVKSHNSHPMSHSPYDLIMLFNGLFRDTHQTVLVMGSDEPEYVPASTPNGLAQVVFAHGYYASALHEISHWCIAGERRRARHDYGYWYCPDGRTRQQQQAFEQVEIKPQAVEWLFAVAAGFRFHVSVDNLSGAGAANEQRFRHNVRAQAGEYLRRGLPPRATVFFNSLARFYGTGETLEARWQDDARRIAPLYSEAGHSRKTETL